MVFHPGCRKCRRLLQNFFCGECTYISEVQKHRTSLHKTSVLSMQNLRTFAQRSPMFLISGIARKGLQKQTDTMPHLIRCTSILHRCKLQCPFVSGDCIFSITSGTLEQDIFLGKRMSFHSHCALDALFPVHTLRLFALLETADDVDRLINIVSERQLQMLVPSGCRQLFKHGKRRHLFCPELLAYKYHRT